MIFLVEVVVIWKQFVLSMFYLAGVPLYIALGSIQHHKNQVSCPGNGDHLPTTTLAWKEGIQVLREHSFTIIFCKFWFE